MINIILVMILVDIGQYWFQILIVILIMILVNTDHGDPVEFLWSCCGDPVEFLWSLESSRDPVEFLLTLILVLILIMILVDIDQKY